MFRDLGIPHGIEPIVRLSLPQKGSMVGAQSNFGETREVSMGVGNMYIEDDSWDPNPARLINAHQFYKYNTSDRLDCTLPYPPPHCAASDFQNSTTP
uniref:Uncharacterized protein n=1 Tax=Romanomermis culicivorax TaxID=13658 RepID=A0A915JXC2_ROMCU